MFWNKNKTKLNPNVLITNYCNQNCSFCFANELMTKGKTKEISIKNYIRLLDCFDKNGIKNICLMGGEPTLHSEFKKIIEISIKRGFRIELFTNANLSDDIENYLIENSRRISTIHINIGAPAYVADGYKKINNFIDKVDKKTLISLETTIASMDEKEYLQIFRRAKTVLGRSYIRIAVDGGLIINGGFSVRKNLEIGKLIIKTIDLLKKGGARGVWLCEVNACMFTDNQRKIIGDNKFVKLSGYGCLSKRAGVDIKTDLRIIRCFRQDCLKGITFNKGIDLEKIKKDLDEEMIKISKKLLPDECCLCKFYGYEKDMCPGPCLIER